MITILFDLVNVLEHIFSLRNLVEIHLYLLLHTQCKLTMQLAVICTLLTYGILQNWILAVVHCATPDQNDAFEQAGLVQKACYFFARFACVAYYECALPQRLEVVHDVLT